MKSRVLTKIEASNFLKTKKIDIFMSSASFEERCLDICQIVFESRLSFEKYILFGNIDFSEQISELRNKMSNLLAEEGSPKLQQIDLKINDPVYSFVQMIKICNIVFQDSPKVLLLDITTFTHESLLVLFKLVMSKKREDDKIILIYSGAKSYSYNSLNHRWLSKGVKEIRSVIGYPGYFDPSKKNHLIILFGIEVERVIKLIELFEFESVSIGFGAIEKTISTELHEVNLNKRREISNLYPYAEFFEFSLNDPDNTKQEILTYVERYSNYNNVIIPMNNKISTIGVGLAAIENLDIQIFYMQANIYNLGGYSQSSDNFFVYEL